MSLGYDRVSHSTITRDEIVEHVRRVAAGARLTLEEFMALGHADELDGELRETWLMFGLVVEER
jgi:hypothetical protein